MVETKFQKSDHSNVQVQRNELGVAKHHVHCPKCYARTPIERLLLKTKRQGKIHEKKREQEAQCRSAKQKLQEELGELLLAMLSCRSENERYLYLRFIQSTLEKSITLSG